MYRDYSGSWSSYIPTQSRIIEYVPENLVDYVPYERRIRDYVEGIYLILLNKS